MPGSKIAKVASVAAQVRYPLGLADFEFAVLGEDGQPIEPYEKLRLLLTSTEARQIAEHLTKLAEALELKGGTKQ